MSMASVTVICNRCAEEITGRIYPNENWCPGCEPVQMKNLRKFIAAYYAYREAMDSDDFIRRASASTAIRNALYELERER